MDVTIKVNGNVVAHGQVPMTAPLTSVHFRFSTSAFAASRRFC
jgi:hypothetical protein